MWSSAGYATAAAVKRTHKGPSKMILGTNTRKNPQLRPAERILLDRGVKSVTQIMHSPTERIRKLLSTRTAHRILPLSPTDSALQVVRETARKILLDARMRSRASRVEKNGIPILRPINGMGKFILPLQRVVFTYCSHQGDSRGMRDFLTNNLTSIAGADPGIEMVVECRWGKFPMIYAHYLDGQRKDVCVKGKTGREIEELYERVREQAGKRARFRQKVVSKGKAVRAIWSPFHMQNNNRRNNPLLPFKLLNN